jgi:hypothetical protein
MKRFIFAATIAVALFGSQFANAQTRDNGRYNDSGNEQYENNQGDEGRYEDNSAQNNDDRYEQRGDEAEGQYDNRQGERYDDRRDDRNGQQYEAQGGQEINREDYGAHRTSPVREQYMRLRQVKRMAWADGYLSYRERAMIAREEDRLDWMKRRYGR